jgi:hypothetical protein
VRRERNAREYTWAIDEVAKGADSGGGSVGRDLCLST